MKTSCEIINDLLPLYYDNVCSAESRVLVEEHIKECSSCKKLLHDIADDLARPVSIPDETRLIKAIQTVWKKDKAKSFFKGTVIAVLICTMLIGGYFGLTEWYIVPVPTNLIDVSEISILAGGRLAYHLRVNDDKELNCINTTTNDDGSYYMTPMRPILSRKRNIDIGFFDNYYDIEIADRNVNANGGEGTYIVIKSCYVGTPKDRILIWEDGMELPAASEELEKRFSDNN